MKMTAVLIVLFFAILPGGVVDTAAQSNDLKILSAQRLAESKARIENARRVAAQHGWMQGMATSASTNRAAYGRLIRAMRIIRLLK